MMDTAATQPRQPRRLFMEDHIEPRLCQDGCIGPFERRADMDDWLTKMYRNLGRACPDLLPQYTCGTCRTTRGYTSEELARVA